MNRQPLTAEQIPNSPPIVSARFGVGDVVRHRMFDFRGVIFDVDPVFANSEEWYEAIPAEIRPTKEQPFYHLLAENDESTYVAYVSQQNLVGDASGGPVDHPGIDELFGAFENGRYNLKPRHRH
jgi:heat shock protein HspQ